MIGFDDTSKPSDPAAGGGGGLLDLDLMMAGPTTDTQAASNVDNMMDLFGGGSTAPVTQ